MKYYIEVTLLPGVDIGLHFLWGKVFQQIHLGLVEMKNPNGTVPIGISFPEYNSEKHEIGSKLRFFAADKSLLESLDIAKWLRFFNDCVLLTRIRSVPEHISAYACYFRQQPKSSKQRLSSRFLENKEMKMSS